MVRWIASTLICTGLIALGACGGNALPELPATVSDDPAAVEWVGLFGLDDAPLDAMALTAGSVVKVRLRILNKANAPSSGAALNLSARAVDFADLLRFPDGGLCFSNAQGECDVVVASQGGAGEVMFTARVAATLPVVAEFPLAVVARSDDLQVKITVQGVGSATYAGEESDPLVVLERVLLNADVDSGRLITVELTDRYHNPVARQGMELMLPTQQEAVIDAGAAQTDLGAAADSGAASDASLASDSGASNGDAATRDLSVARDSGVAAADGSAVLDSGAARGDGGGALQPTADVLVRVSASSDCGAATVPTAPGAATTDVDGKVHYCLFATSYRGDWRVLLRVPSVISAPLEPHQETALALDGRTVAGEPTQLSARIDGDKVRCNPGRESPVIRFRVSNAQGEGVPGVRVLFEAVGGLDGLSRQVGETNNQGDASVKAFCPAARVQGAAVSARVQRPELGPVSVPIEVRADAVSTIYIEADAANPQVVHDGAELRFSVSASDANGVQVLHPVGSDEPLLLGFGVASSGHAGTLLLGEVPILAQSLAVDEDGLIDLRLTVRSRATMDQPIRLRVQTLDGAVSAEQAIAVAPGAPSQLVLQPAGRVQALVGGVGGMLNLRVLDGDEINTANGVPGVAISISAPPQVRLGRNLGNTDAAGRFESMIILVDRPGDHTLTVRASQGEWSAEAELVVEGTTGVPQGIAVQLGGVILVPTGAQGEQPAHEVTLRTSEVLANTLSLRLVNDQGGGIPELGLTIEHIEGSEADCARWQAPGVTDEAGQVRYGAGQLTLTAGPRVTRCLYRISHGNSPASILMRIIQLPGKPLQAWLEPAQRRALANYGRRPSGWTDETSLAVTLRAVDSNQIPTEGFRMWLDVSNCWVSSRDFLLNDQGSATFRVAGGPDANAPCRLSPRYSDELDGFQPPLQRPILVLESGGYLAPQLVRIESDGTTDPQDAENGHSERSVFSRGQARGRWLIVANAATLQLPEPVRNGLCDPTQCTHLQLVQMRRSDHGDLTLDLDENGSPYILQDEIPLDLSLNEGRMTVYATISESWMGAARWLGLRLKQPGPEGAVSSAWGFFVHPGFGFSGPGHAGSGDRLDLLPPTGNGPVTLRDGRRVDLNDDGEDELLLCGTDEGGSWYAIVALDQDGGLPDQPVRGIRSWSGLGDQFPAQANRKYMCPVGDINNDGRLDLIMPTPSVEAMPTITIHQGIAGEQIFDAQGTVLTWNDRSVRGLTYQALTANDGPSAVIALFGRIRKRLLIDTFAQPMRASNVQSVSGNDTALAALDTPDWARFSQTDDLFILADGRLDGCMEYSSIKTAVNDTLAVNYLGQTLRVMDFSSRQIIRQWQQPNIMSFTLAAGAERLATVDSQRLVKVFNARTGQVLFQHQLILEGEEPVRENIRAFELDHNGEAVMLHVAYRVREHHNNSHFAWVADLERDQVNTVPGDSYITDPPSVLRSGTAELLHVGQNIHLPYRGIWSSRSGRSRRRVVDSTHDIRLMAVSSDGRLLAHNNYYSIALVDLEQEQRVGTLRWSELRACGSTMGFDPTSRFLLCDLKILDLETALVTRTLPRSNNNSSYNYVGARGRWTAEKYQGRHVCQLGPAHSPFPMVGYRAPGFVLGGQASSEGSSHVFLGESSAVRLLRPYSMRPLCGNGIIDEGERFDEGSPDLATQFTASCGASCGDDQVQSGEACDDGNNINGDGCDRLCQAE